MSLGYETRPCLKKSKTWKGGRNVGKKKGKEKGREKLNVGKEVNKLTMIFVFAHMCMHM